MGNNPQKSARLKQISRYEVGGSDEEQSEKHLITANQFYYWEEYDRAKEYYLQSLRYNHKNIKALTNLALVYKKQQKIYDAFICILNKVYIENGYEEYMEEKIVNKSSGNQLISLATEYQDDQNSLQQNQNKQMNFAQRYFLSNKTLMEMLPLMKDDFFSLIQQMKQNNKKFELMFFIEQYKERFNEFSEDNQQILCEIYNLYNMYQKALNIYLELLKQQPNNQIIIQNIIQCYQSLNNNEKVIEYKQLLNSSNTQ